MHRRTGWFVVSAAARDTMHSHKRRLHGRDRDDRPHGQTLWGRCTQVAPQEFCYVIFETVKHLKYEFIIMPVTKVMQISALQEAQLLLGDRATRKHAKDC